MTDNSTGKSFDMPVMSGSVGPKVVDVRPFYRDTGMFTYDPGFTSTGSCESKITYIDGEAGILMHRGYRIEDLCEHSDFMEVCFLLLNGELPNQAEKKEFETTITYHSMVHEQLNNLYRGFRRDAHPMAIMVGVVGALSAFYHDSTDINDPEQRMIASHRLVAKMPTIAAWAYKYSIGQPFMYPRNDLAYADNFLRMMFAVPCEDYEVNKVLAAAMDKIFILHADHEQNASTSTVRLAGSSGANPFACIAAGISSLWGPSHGGANEAVLDMLGEIGSVDRVPEFLDKGKDPNDPFRLMGFGHRVYKAYDPRASIIKRTADEVFEVTGRNPLLDIALELERIALNEDFFVERNLYPNVDFYSGLIYQAMGFPVEMFPVLFAIPRTVGWLAQWEELLNDPEQRIARPRQVFEGASERDFVLMDDRT